MWRLESVVWVSSFNHYTSLNAVFVGRSAILSEIEMESNVRPRTAKLLAAPFPSFPYLSLISLSPSRLPPLPIYPLYHCLPPLSLTIWPAERGQAGQMHRGPAICRGPRRIRKMLSHGIQLYSFMLCITEDTLTSSLKSRQAKKVIKTFKLL